jgi:DNA-directed RNA polymerase specialized sigma24 family protein
VGALSDEALRELFATDVHGAWRSFVDDYTPTIVALIERAGVRDRDEAMEVYTLVCERLADDDCARLRRWDPSKGRLGAWLAVVVRRVMVDWVRSRAGRPRLFGAIQQLDPIAQQVFQLYYWANHTPSAIAEQLTVTLGRPVKLLDVLAALDAIHDVMNARQFGELLSMTARSKPAVSLETELEAGRLDPPHPEVPIDTRVEASQREAALSSALANLPAEDAAIVRLHYLHGLGLDDVKRALHLNDLSRARIAAIVESIKIRLLHLEGQS